MYDHSLYLRLQIVAADKIVLINLTSFIFRNTLVLLRGFIVRELASPWSETHPYGVEDERVLTTKYLSLTAEVYHQLLYIPSSPPT